MSRRAVNGVTLRGRAAYRRGMITCGVDLASQSADTAIAVIDWGTASPRLTQLEIGVDDEIILEAAHGADHVAIASPFGWPDPFLEFIVSNRTGTVPNPRRVATTSGRNRIMYRTTDQRLREMLGLKLLPSTANSMAAQTLRCAGILARLREMGIPVSRAGGGRVFEAYAPASLVAWGLDEPKYKTTPAARVRIVEQAARRVSLDLADHRAACMESDDALDALVCALTARAVALGLWRQPLDPDEVEHAPTEGWVCIPSGTIDQLRESPADGPGVPR